LSQYTGLPEKTIDLNNLRIGLYQFIPELLKDEKQIVGRLDSRFKCINLGEGPYSYITDDPSSSATSGAFTAVVNDYIRNELKYANDLPYWSLAMDVFPWNFGDILNNINLPRILKKAINCNNELKVMIANGYYDMATPYFATLFEVEHINLPPHLQKNIIMKYYESGHMMYIHKASRQKLRDDAYAFYMSSMKH
jgi:carboxypeptidase C (cathepsin A)